MSITLTNEFKETSYTGFDVVYEADEMFVFVLSESFSLLPGSENYTLQEYAQLVIEANNLENVEIKTEDGLVYFEYTSDKNSHLYHYTAYVYKSSDSFWLIQFATFSSEANEYRNDIKDWAKSVEFAK